MNAIDVDGLCASWLKIPVLQDIRLQAAPGSVTGLLGPNGAGKSMLMRAIAGRLRPDRGEVRLFGEPVASSPAARESLGWVPQIPALYPQLGVRENLETFGRLRGLGGAALRARVDAALALGALEDVAGARVATLSVGVRSRINIAVGTLHTPRVLLLDEPTAGVDPLSRERIYRMVEDLRGQGATVVYITHYIEEAERLCDQVVIVNHGHVIAQGTPNELVERVAGPDRLLVIESAPVTPALFARLGARGVACHFNGAQARLPDIAGSLRDLLQEFELEQVEIRNLRLRKPSLESVFLQLTGRELPT